jgi:hypothetical protein
MSFQKDTRLKRALEHWSTDINDGLDGPNASDAAQPMNPRVWDRMDFAERFGNLQYGHPLASAVCIGSPGLNEHFQSSA